ncbi:MAG: CAP domain-containing protein, partial [Acidobacteriota bacterium]|nr:CAP domain-containing protein [Acidobacteriota bacterium]
MFRPIFASILIGLHCLVAAQGSSQALARQVVAQINWARQDPQAAAAELKTWLPKFEGDRYLAFPDEPRLRTEEGPKAVEEAITFLEKQKPLAPVAWSDRLRKAAEDLARDQARHGGLGHQASDGSLPWGRIARYGKVSGSMGEVVTYGTFGEPGDPRRAVLALIVDDGVADRGHRAILYDPDFTLAGAAWGPHPIYTRMVVVDFASGFLRDLEPRPEESRRGGLARAVVAELNRARQDPQGCAKELRTWLAFFRPGGVRGLPGEDPVQTVEGPAAVQRAITLLEALKPLPPVQWP